MPESPATANGVLVITRNFPPLVGGMERVSLELVRSLASSRSVTLIGPAGCSRFVPLGVDTREARIAPLWRFLLACAWEGWREAARSPSWVLAGSGLAAPMAWISARRGGSRSAVYLHGLDIIVPNRTYQWLWLPFIRRFSLVLVNSRNTARLAAERGVPIDRIHILHPGTVLPPAPPADKASIRSKLGWDDVPTLLSVGRLTRRKGMAEFVAHALPAIVKKCPNLVLAIVGGEAENALHGVVAGEKERIRRIACNAGVEGNIRFHPHYSDERLREAYYAADCHVFPVMDVSGDVEGFGMVALESAAHGLPTVAFGVGGIPDAVKGPDSGTLVEPRDYASFADSVLNILARDGAARARAAESGRVFASGFEWTRFGRSLRDLLDAPNSPNTIQARP